MKLRKQIKRYRAAADVFMLLARVYKDERLELSYTAGQRRELARNALQMELRCLKEVERLRDLNIKPYAPRSDAELASVSIHPDCA